MNGGIQLLDQLIYVVPPPVADIRVAGAVFGVGVRIVKVCAGVEVVVQVDAVNVVIFHQLHSAVHNQLPDFRKAGIQVVVAVGMPDHPIGVEQGGVCGS